MTISFSLREVTRSNNKPRVYYYIHNYKNSRVFASSISFGELKENILNRVYLKYKLTKKMLFTEDERLFKILVIYGGVRQTIRNALPYRILTLSKKIISMDEFSLQFWYTEFLSRYSERHNIVDTYRVGKAFRDLYE